MVPLRPYIQDDIQDEARGVSHGGKRAGAGRPSGPAWKPAIAAMRVAAVDRLQEAISGDTDPLVIVLGIAADTKQPVELRLGACALAIPVMYPRLSAATVQATHVTTNINATELLDRIAERIARQSPAAAIEGKNVEQIEGGSRKSMNEVSANTSASFRRP